MLSPIRIHALCVSSFVILPSPSWRLFPFGHTANFVILRNYFEVTCLFAVIGEVDKRTQSVSHVCLTRFNQHGRLICVADARILFSVLPRTRKHEPAFCAESWYRHINRYHSVPPPIFSTATTALSTCPLRSLAERSMSGCKRLVLPSLRLCVAF